MIFQFILEIYGHRQNKDKNKMKLPLPSSTVSLIAEKLLNLLVPNTLKFLELQFPFINFLWKIKHICMSGLFSTANFLGRNKNFLLSLWTLAPSKAN